jgi:ADP-ribosyl-[dinitrogen reductase] hydrolase
MTRTSITHPLQIATVSAGPGFGQIGITFCPGKYDRHAMTGTWDRDLALDLEAVHDWGAVAVITLIEPKEMTLLRVEALGAEVMKRGMTWFHLPIVDVSTPGKDFERRWDVEGAKILSLLRSKRSVVVHCRGGLGRAGTIAARLLVELGIEASTAVTQVRAVRPGAIETLSQEQYVLGLAAQI